MINLFPCLSLNGWKICQTFPSEWEGYILPTVKMMMHLLICSWKLEFNLEQSCLFSPRCLFFNTGLHKSVLPPMTCWIHHWAQDILIRYAFTSPCKSWMLSLRPIFCQQCELINLSCCKVNQFHLVTTKLLDLMEGKKTSLERDWEGSQITSVWWLGHWGGWHQVFLSPSSQLGTTGFIQTCLSYIVR